MLAVPWLNPNLLHWGVQRTGGRTQQRKRNSVSSLQIKQRDWHQKTSTQAEQAEHGLGQGAEPGCCETGKKKSCQGKNSRESSCNGARYFLSSVRACFPPSHALYCYLIVLYSVCKEGLQLLQSAKAHFSTSEKNHWICPLHSALPDFQRTANAILQRHPHLKALGCELKLPRKINRSSGVKIVVDSFAPLPWTELSKTRVTVICVGPVSGCETRPLQEHHKALSAKYMSPNVCLCVCAHMHAHVRDHAHTIYKLCMCTQSKW